MICGSCGRQNPAGARYCIHCGAEQSVPTPIAAVAASNAAVMRAEQPRAANAAQAEPASVATLRVAPRPAGQIDDVSAVASPALQSSPAYARLPRRGRLAAALIALCIVVGIAAVALWRLQRGADDASIMAGYSGKQRDVRAAQAPPPNAAQSAATGAAAPSADRAAATASIAAAPAGASGSPPPSVATAGETPEAGASVREPASIEIRQLPARPSHPRSARRAAAAEKEAPAPPTVEAPVLPPTPARPTVAAAPASPAVDRWARMNDDLARCTREDFISRVICGQRVRFRYCDGYWGKVAQCPASPAPERGQ